MSQQRGAITRGDRVINMELTQKQENKVKEYAELLRKANIFLRINDMKYFATDSSAQKFANAEANRKHAETALPVAHLILARQIVGND